LQFFADSRPRPTGSLPNLLAALGKVEWVVYASELLADPTPSSPYLSRYTHVLLLANSRLVTFDASASRSKWKDSGQGRRSL